MAKKTKGPAMGPAIGAARGPGNDAGKGAGGGDGGEPRTCLNCGTRFSVAEGERARCPKCLRVHGVEDDAPGQGAVANPPAKRSWVPAVLGVAVLVAGVGGYFVWKAQKGRTGGGGGGSAGAASNAAGASPALLRALKDKGVGEDRAIAAVAESGAISSKAKEILAGKTSPLAQAQALWSVAEGWLKARSGRAGTEWLLRQQLVRPTPKAFEELSQGAPGEVYGLELAATLLSLARAGGANVAAAELVSQEKIRAEAGPQLANIGVAFYGAGEAPAAIIDVLGGRVVEGGAARRLSDVELTAHFYGARAGYFFLRSEGTRANAESELAGRLDEKGAAIAATRAMVLIAFGQVEPAMTQLRRAVELGAGAARWQVLLCLGYLRGGSGEDAVQACKKGVDKEPGAAGAHVALAYAYLAAGEADKAREAAEQARKLDDADADVHKGLAQVYAAQGDGAKASAALDQALRIEPKARGIHLLRALMAMKEMDFDAATKAMRAEVEVDSENERVRALLASTLLRAGKKDEAEKVLGELRSRSRDTAITDQLIAEVRKEAGDDDPADADADGGPDDDAPVDGGPASVPATAPGPVPGPAPTPGAGASAASPPTVARPAVETPRGAPKEDDADKDDKDDKDEKDDVRVEAGDTVLPMPGKAPGGGPSLFKLSPGSGN